MGARYRVGIRLSYRPARLHRLAEFIPLNRFLGSINVYGLQCTVKQFWPLSRGKRININLSNCKIIFWNHILFAKTSVKRLYINLHNIREVCFGLTLVWRNSGRGSVSWTPPLPPSPLTPLPLPPHPSLSLSCIMFGIWIWVQQPNS